MYELVITTGQDYVSYESLLSGTYADICNMTSKLDGTDDIRSKYKKVIDNYLKDKKGDGRIVVLKHIDPEHPQDVVPYQVIYKSDKALFNKLLQVPKKKDIVYSNWLEFWTSLVSKVVWKKFVPNSPENIAKNEKIEENNNRFSRCSNIFYQILNNTSEYFRRNFKSYYINKYPNEIFHNFKNFLKEEGNEDLYYEFAAVVVKAFGYYEIIYSFYENNGKDIFNRYDQLKNHRKNKISDQLKKQLNHNEKVEEDDYEYEIYDQNNNVHSSEFLALQSAIDNRDIETIKNFVETYGIDGFTEEELMEIKFLLNQNNVHKKR